MSSYSTSTSQLRTTRLGGFVLLFLFLTACGNITITEIDDGPAPLEPLRPTETVVEGAISYVMPTATTPYLSGPRRTSGAIEAASLDSADVIPEPEDESAPPTATPLAINASVPQRYQVKKGDTLRVIAINHAISIEMLQKANNLPNEDIQPGQMLNIPTADQIVAYEIQQGAAIPTPQTETGDLIHYIQSGETVSSIAELYNVEKRDLLYVNGYRPDVQLIAGSPIMIPQEGYEALPTATAVLPLMSTPSPSPAAVALAEPTATAVPAPPATGATTYIVESGDYAKTIAEENGVTLDALRSANPGQDLDSLAVGQELTLPASASSASPPPQPTATRVPPTPTVPAPTATPVVETASEFELTEPVSEVETPTAQPPMLTLPENGSVWTYQPARKPFQLVWTPMDWLDTNHYYVLQMWAESDSGKVFWSESVWLQASSWRVPTQWLNRIEGEANIKWNVRIMALLSGDPELTIPAVQGESVDADSEAAASATEESELPRGQVLSRKSETFTITVVVPSE